MTTRNPYSYGPAFQESGLGSPLPLPYGKKASPPKGFSGKAGVDPSADQVVRWASGERSNIACRLHDGKLGIDVDDYDKRSTKETVTPAGDLVTEVHTDEKHGGKTLQEAIDKCGPLPKTWKSSSRSNDISGIYWFNVPKDMAWPDSMGPDIEVIHRGYRYAVVPPSRHPEGRDYFWTRPDGSVADEGEIPSEEDLAELPQKWIEHFQDLKSATNVSATGRAHGEDWSQNDEVDQLPGTDFNRRGDWGKDILEPAGWRLIRTDTDGVQYWGDPRKADKTETSATVGKAKDSQQNDALYMHTSSVPPFKQHETYNKHMAYTILIHGGDGPEHRSAAVKALAKQGYGKQETIPDLTNYQGGDVENARLFAEWYGEDLRWVPERKSWYWWDSEKWVCNGNLIAQTKAKQIGKRVFQATWNETDEQRRKWLISQSTKLREQKGVRGAINMAQDTLAASIEEFDTSKYLLNVENGTLNLGADDIAKVLQKHTREDMLSTQTGVPYHPAAPCPTWEKFLQTATNNDPEMIRYIQKFVGYCLTGDVSDKSLFFLYGVTDSGKTQFVEALRALLGLSYTTIIRPDVLMQKPRGGPASTNNEDIANMVGKRFATVSELRSEDRLDIALIKELTGGGLQAASRKYESVIKFIPQAKIMVDTNHKPQVIVDDIAFWNRVRIIEFNVRIPKHEQDKYLQSKFHKEMPGILAWAVRGWFMAKKEGLTPPRKVTDAVETYQREEDWLQDFLEDECELNAAEETKSSDVYARYQEWGRNQGIRNILNNNAFGRKLTEKGFLTSKHNQTTWRVGFRLAEHYTMPAEIEEAS